MPILTAYAALWICLAYEISLGGVKYPFYNFLQTESLEVCDKLHDSSNDKVALQYVTKLGSGSDAVKPSR